VKLVFLLRFEHGACWAPNSRLPVLFFRQWLVHATLISPTSTRNE